MVLMIVPECTKCKTAKNVIFRNAYTSEPFASFHIAYCVKCHTVMQCSLTARALTKREERELRSKRKSHKVKTHRKSAKQEKKQRRKPTKRWRI